MVHRSHISYCITQRNRVLSAEISAGLSIRRTARILLPSWITPKILAGGRNLYIFPFLVSWDFVKRDIYDANMHEYNVLYKHMLVLVIFSPWWLTDTCPCQILCNLKKAETRPHTIKRSYLNAQKWPLHRNFLTPQRDIKLVSLSKADPYALMSLIASSIIC